MNVFVICPVRLGVKAEVTRYVEQLESQGHKVYYPPRDTNQDDETGYNICVQNKEGILQANEVHLFYNALSQGIHFDLGIAFALRRKIKLIKVLEAENPAYPTQKGGKSYLRMIKEWEGRK